MFSKLLNFVIPSKTIHHADFMLPFELLYRNVDSLEVPSLNKECIKSRIINKGNSKTLEKNFPKEEFDALKIHLKKSLS